MDDATFTDEAIRGLGGDLRALRKSRGVTLSDLAERLNRSVGWLSQVERGLSQPSIDDLRGIAAIFDVPLSLFFGHDDAPDSERGLIVRAAGRRRIGDPESGLTEELLSPDLGGAFEMVRSVFAPGAELQKPQRRDTEEAGYVIAGRLDLWVENNLFQLTPGDSFRFKNALHRWRNPGEVEAVVIWTIAPPVY